jgi:crotonobetainyl-CoA:carnitine CoA-transferase CaiB-like acyl-CoA transferase
MSNQLRVKNRLELADIIKDKLIHVEADDFLSRCHEMYVPAARIKNLAEVFQDLPAQQLVRQEEILGVNTKRITSIAFKWK